MTPHERRKKSMHMTLLSAAGAAAAVVLTVAQLAPAQARQADAIGVKDRADLDHGVDLRSVVLDHRAENVVVTTTHKNLRPSFHTGSAGAVYLDTDELDAGPEYVFVGAFFAGSDYQLLNTEGFGHQRWGMPVEGFYELRLRYLRNQAMIRIARDTIGSPDEVRVAVRVAGTRRDGTARGMVDWLKEPRSFTKWVAR